MSEQVARSLVIALTVCLSACGEGAPTVLPKPPLVLWLEVDTLRADALGCYGSGLLGKDYPSLTPNLDALAAEGLLFDAAYSAAPWTVPSVASALTGKWPWEHGATRLLSKLQRGHVTIAERLQSEGFATAGVMTNFIATRKYGFSQGFDLWDDSLALGHVGSTAPAAADLLLEQYDSLAEGDKPIFLFGFFFEPHWRYEAHPETGFGPEPGGMVEDLDDMAEARSMVQEGVLTEKEIRDLRLLYAGEVARVDEAIGKLISGLQERGAWDNALVLFTADHGERLGEKGQLGHTRSLDDVLVRVPMLLRIPANLEGPAPGSVIQTPVSQVDLHSTMLELAGAPLGEANIASRSFAGLLREESDFEVREHLFLHVNFEPKKIDPKSALKRTHKWGVVRASDGTKWIVDHLAEGGPVGKLIDSGADPLELDDLSLDKAESELESYWLLEGLVPRDLDGKQGGLPR